MRLGSYRYDKQLRGGRSIPVRVDVFPLEVERRHDDWPEKGQREAIWVTPERGGGAGRGARPRRDPARPGGSAPPVRDGRRGRGQADSLTGIAAGVSARDRRVGTARSGSSGSRSIGAGEPAAALDLDLAIADVAGHAAGGPDQEPLAHGERALVDAGDLGLVDLGLAVGEAAGLGDLDRPGAVERDLDAALDHQPVAGGDLAGQVDVRADDQQLGRRLGGRCRGVAAPGSSSPSPGVPAASAERRQPRRRRVGLSGHALSPLQTHLAAPYGPAADTPPSFRMFFRRDEVKDNSIWG